HARLLELPHALADGGGGEPHGLGEAGEAGPAVLPQEREDAPVDGVESHDERESSTAGAAPKPCYRGPMRVLFVGDVFATPGMTAATAFVKERRDEFDLVVVNGENAAGGFGITRRHFEQLVEAGADVVTLGNHAFDQPDALALL